MSPIAALFFFSLRQTLLDRKIWLTVLLLVGPMALVTVIRSFAPPFDAAGDLWDVYHHFVQYLFLMLLVPLVCMLHGIALIGTEIETRTIGLLIARRMRRATVFVTKFAATAVALVLLCDLGLLGMHASMFFGQDLPSLIGTDLAYADWNPTSDLTFYLLIVPLAVLAFLALFSLFGVLTTRPLPLSVMYVVVVELIVSNLPVGARVYSLLHPLRVTLAGHAPRLARLYDMPAELQEELYPPGATGVPTLLGIILVCLVLAGIATTYRELMPAKVSRE